jgi:hypothetical protein
MVEDGFSTPKIRIYLRLWALWWVRSSETWNYEDLLESFIEVCWDLKIAALAIGLLQKHINKSYIGHSTVSVSHHRLPIPSKKVPLDKDPL